jgi:hypothetical protein
VTAGTRRALRASCQWIPLINQIACCLYGADYDINLAKAIVAIETGSLAAWVTSAYRTSGARMRVC